MIKTKIKDQKLKSLVWSTQLSNAWRNYQFERSELESKQRFYWSTLIALISVVGILVGLFSFIDNLAIKILFFIMISSLILGLGFQINNLRKSLKKKVKKETFVKSKSFVKLLNHFDDVWVVGPIVGKFRDDDSLMDLQDFSIDTLKWIRKRKEIVEEREKELLSKLGNSLANLKLEIGEKFKGVCLAIPKGWGSSGKVDWQSGYLKDKKRELPFVCFKKKAMLGQGLFEINGRVSNINKYYTTFTGKGFKKALIIEESKSIESFYDSNVKGKIKKYHFD